MRCPGSVPAGRVTLVTTPAGTDRCDDDRAGRTPYLVVDRDVLEDNLAAPDPPGIAVRPHVKTHKCVEIARRQLDAGAVGITVATVGEAEVFADAGCDDVFLAYPVLAVGRRGERLAALARRIRLRVGVDSVAAAHVLAAAVGQECEVLVEVDSGQHRTGVAPGDAGTVATGAVDAGLDVVGVFTFPGHSYAPGAGEAAAHDESAALAEAAASLAAADVQARVRSGGSTPSRTATDATVVTEMRPGVYAVNDAQQWELGSCGRAEIALTAAATVVSRRPGRVVLDAGSKILGADRPPWATGFGRLLDHPDARVVALSEHHATVDLADPPPLGAVVRVVPNHACNAVNLVDELTVVADGVEVDRWTVAARGM